MNNIFLRWIKKGVSKLKKTHSKIKSVLQKRRYRFAPFPDNQSTRYRIEHYKEEAVKKIIVDSDGIETVVDQMPRKSGIIEVKNAKVIAGLQGFVKKNRIYSEEFYEYKDILNAPRFPVMEFKSQKCVVQEKPNKNNFESKFGLICILASRSDCYYHMMVEYIGRLAYILKFDEYREKDILVTKEFYSVGINKEAFDYIRKIAGHKGNVYQVEEGFSVKIKYLIYPLGHVIYPQGLKPNKTGYYERIWQNPIGIISIRDVINSNLPNDIEQNNKIYISRSMIKGRERVSNNKEIEKLLIEKGFAIVHPEEYSFKEQIMLFRKAKIVVVCEGSAVANVVFCALGTEVILLSELEDPGSYLFPSYISDLGLTVRTVAMTLEEGSEYKYGNGLYRVNIDILKRMF